MLDAEEQDLQADDPAPAELPFSSADIRFIGNQFYFIVFYGYSHGKVRIMWDELEGSWEALDRGITNYQL